MKRFRRRIQALDIIWRTPEQLITLRLVDMAFDLESRPSSSLTRLRYGAGMHFQYCRKQRSGVSHRG
jgi:hypothetical protein